MLGALRSSQNELFYLPRKKRDKPRPQGFPLKKWVGRVTRFFFFKGKAVGTRLKRETNWPIADQHVPCSVSGKREIQVGNFSNLEMKR